MPDQYLIHLNFLPLAGDLPSFRVYRKERQNAQEPRPADNIQLYSLPRGSNDVENRAMYWVCFDAQQGYEQCTVAPNFNNELTRWALFRAVCDSATSRLTADQFTVPENTFIHEINFKMQPHTEGEELLVVQPYVLRATHQFGFLVDFHLRLAETARFSRRVQQLCLSLDRNYRRNLDYYVDRSTKIRKFVNDRWSVLSPLTLPGATQKVEVSKDFAPLAADRLKQRVYVFASGREAKSQFVGLRDYGPLKPPSSSPKLLFVFRERERQAARTLAMALRGSRERQRFNFPGFEALFKSPLQIDSNPIILTDLSDQAMQTALERVQTENPRPVPVLVVPDGEENGYLAY